MKKVIFILITILLIGCKANPHDKGIFKIALYGFNLQECVTIYASMKTWQWMTQGAVQLDVVPYGEEDAVIMKSDNLPAQGATVPDLDLIILYNVDHRIICHELGHLIGLIHEFQRPDRDIWITINWDLLQLPVEKLQFIPIETKQYNNMKYDYDYMSVMNIKDSDFPGLIDSHGHEIGGDSVSPLDAAKVVEIYENKREELIKKGRY